MANNGNCCFLCTMTQQCPTLLDGGRGGQPVFAQWIFKKTHEIKCSILVQINEVHHLNQRLKISESKLHSNSNTNFTNFHLKCKNQF